MATYPESFSLKKHLSSSLEPSQPSYLAGISLELHLVTAWPYKPYRTGCEGPVQSMSARRTSRSRPLRSGQLHFSRPHTYVCILDQTEIGVA